MTRTHKRLISMAVVLVLITALGVVYFTQTEPYEPDPDAELRAMQQLVNELIDTPYAVLISRNEMDMTQVTFTHNTGEVYTMSARRNQFGLAYWVWQPTPDYILHRTLSLMKVQPAWSLMPTEQAFENSNDINLADFGLYPPQLTLLAEYDDGTSNTIFIGGYTGDMQSRFVQLAGNDGVYLIPASHATPAFATIEEMIDRELPFFSLAAEYVRIEPRGNNTIELGLEFIHGMEAFAGLMHEADDGRVLTMRQPIPGQMLHHPHVQDNIFAPLDFLQIGEIVSIAPTDLSPYGLDDPWIRFYYFDQFGQVALHFGDTFMQEGTSYVYVRFADRPHVFMAESAPIAGLTNIQLFHIVDRFIALTNIDYIDMITSESQISERNFTLEINHYNGSISPTKNGEPVNDEDFRIAYRNLIALSADVEIPQNPPTEAPDHTVTLHGRGAANDTTLEFFQYDANFYAVSVNGVAPWFLTNSRGVDEFFASVNEL